MNNLLTFLLIYLLSYCGKTEEMLYQNVDQLFLTGLQVYDDFPLY